MKLKIIQDKEVKEVIDCIYEMGEIDDWNLMFDDLPEHGFVNHLTFEEMLAKYSIDNNSYLLSTFRD